MAPYAYWCVLLGVFVTAFYSFRLVFMTFHGEERFHADEHHKPHESPWVVKGPLVLLAIPSLVIGWLTVKPILSGTFFGNAIFVLPAHDVLGHMKEEFESPARFVLHAFQGVPVYLAAFGVLAAWFLYIKRPDLPGQIAARVQWLYKLLANKFYFDELYQAVFARGSRGLGTALWRVGDVALIDGGMVNGSARVVGWLSGLLRHLQSGFLYHYAFAMIIGLSVLLAWYVLR
jgi:NADH-quinone oxidoreductase subunit L